MNTAQVDGLVTQSSNLNDAHVPAQRAPKLYEKMKISMTTSQAFDIKSKMSLNFGKDIDKPGCYRIKDLLSCFMEMIEDSSLLGR